MKINTKVDRKPVRFQLQYMKFTPTDINSSCIRWPGPVSNLYASISKNNQIMDQNCKYAKQSYCQTDAFIAAYLHQLRHRTSASDVQCILHNSSLSDIWESQLPDPNLAKPIKEHVELLYQDFWTQEINNSLQYQKLRFYKQINEEFIIEPCFCINIPKYRQALSKLRLMQLQSPWNRGQPIYTAYLSHQQIKGSV